MTHAQSDLAALSALVNEAESLAVKKLSRDASRSKTQASLLVGLAAIILLATLVTTLNLQAPFARSIALSIGLALALAFTIQFVIVSVRSLRRESQNSLLLDFSEHRIQTTLYDYVAFIRGNLDLSPVDSLLLETRLNGLSLSISLDGRSDEGRSRRLLPLTISLEQLQSLNPRGRHAAIAERLQSLGFNRDPDQAEVTTIFWRLDGRGDRFAHARQGAFLVTIDGGSGSKHLNFGSGSPESIDELTDAAYSAYKWANKA